MSGIGLVLNVAKDALSTQQYALDVVSHNIANVNTEGYSRQLPSLSAKEAAPYAGFMFGRGVEFSAIQRVADSFIDDSLQQRESEYESLYQKQIYMDTLESIFNESSGRSLSSQLSEFWTAWQDLSNNPSGLSERTILIENAKLLSSSFNDIHSDLQSMDISLNSSLQAGTVRANEVMSQIADLNEQISAIEIRGTANDLRDQRNMLLRELSDYMSVNSYEMEDGSLSVTGANGYPLVSGNTYNTVRYENMEITWESSSGTNIAITDKIIGGKLGGWLEMRDVILPKYSSDLDELAESIIWEVNKIHSQGVGTTSFDSLTGSFSIVDAAEELGTADSGLNYYNEIADGTFEVWVYDSAGSVVGGTSTTITIDKDAGGTTLNSLISDLNAIDTGLGIADGSLAASVSGGKLQLSTAGGYTFAFSDDSSNVLAALGTNTFFTGSDANTIAINSALETHEEFLAAGKVGSTGDIATGDNSNAIDMTNLQNTGVTVQRWTYERGATPTSDDVAGTTLETYLHNMEGAIGIESQSIRREAEYSEIVVNQLTQTRDGISGVSIDEEMVNLIKYQQAYNAAAKLISISDEMLSTLMNTK